MNSEDVLVSIGLPVRNGSNHLEEAIISLISQNYKNIEIIISNNDSTDETELICEKYIKLDKRIRYFKQNTMLSAFDNFQFVLKQASGQFFMWAAHDDIRENNYISTQIKYFKDEDIILTFPNLYIDDTISVPYLKEFDFENEQLTVIERMYKTADIQCYHIYGLWRTEALKKINFLHTYWWPDMPIMVCASYLGKFKYVDGTKFVYREEIKSVKKRVSYQDGKTIVPKFMVLKMIYTTFITLMHTSNSILYASLGALFVFWKQFKVFLYIFLVKKPKKLFFK